MKNFKISIIKDGRTIPLTYFENGEQNNNLNFSSFDEELVEKENSQATLTFSISAFVFDNGIKTRNPFIDLLFNGAIVELILDDTDLRRFVISGMTPTVYENNMIVQFVAEDQISFQWQKRNIGYSFSTSDREQIYTINEIAAIVLQENFIADWQVKSSFTTTALQHKKMSLEVENSNPYNVLMEACIILDAYMQVNYRQKFIYFIAKEDIPFSGYRYSPNLNLSELGASANLGEMATILHVKGGESADEENISIVPYIPVAFQLWFLKYADRTALKAKRMFNGSDYSFNISSFGTQTWEIPGKFLYDSTKSYNLVLDLDEIVAEQIEIRAGFIDENLFITKKTVTVPKGRSGIVTLPLLKGLSGGEKPIGLQIYSQDETIVRIREVYLYQTIDIVSSGLRLIYGFGDGANHLMLDTNNNPILSLTGSTYDVGNWYSKEQFELNWYTMIFDFLLANHGHPKVGGGEHHFLFGGDDELTKLQEFAAIADRVPHLGTYFVDFSYYQSCGALPQERFERLNNLFNVDIRKNNIYLKMLMPQKHQLEYECYVLEEEAKQYHEAYVAMCLSLTNELNKNAITTNQNRAVLHLTSIAYPFVADEFKYFENLLALYGTKEKVIEQLKLKFESQIEINDNLSAEHRRIANELEIEIESLGSYTSGHLKTQLIAEKEVHLKKATTYATLGTAFNIPIGGKGVGLYKKLFDIATTYFDAYYNRLTNKNQSAVGLLAVIDDYQAKINATWSEIYKNYGNYIIEQYYENTDEINSAALYEQASIYFSNNNKPEANYNIQILDLSVLELIDIPKLAVGSKIKIYYDKLKLSDTEKNILAYEDNTLMVTETSTELRSRGTQKLKTQKVERYQVLLEKMLLGIRRQK